MDEIILMAVNQGWAHPWLDALFGWVSQKAGFSFPLLLIILALFTLRHRIAGLKLWLLLVLAIGAGDAVGNLIKQATAQYRPCVTLGEAVRLVERPFNVGCNAKPHAMPSNHALNFFLAASFLAVLFRSSRWAVVMGGIAVLVAVSRVYLGVHWPSQVVAGAVLGIMLGWVAAVIAERNVRFVRALLTVIRSGAPRRVSS